MKTKKTKVLKRSSDTFSNSIPDFRDKIYDNEEDVIITEDEISWYDEIDEALRPLVRLLRNNGFNTTYSTAYTMMVDLDVYNLKECERLATLLAANKYENFEIESHLSANSAAFWVRRATLRITGVKHKHDSDTKNQTSNGSQL